MKKFILMILISTNVMAESQWECIHNNLLSCDTWRMITPSGWVVASDNSFNGKFYYAITFVPDPLHTWKI